MVQQGFYADPPGRRIGYHLDGTITKIANSGFGAQRTLTSAEAGRLNDSSTGRLYTGDVGGDDVYAYGNITWIFPEERDITHYHAACDSTGHGTPHYEGAIQVSKDTTTGYDGTWITVIDPYINDEANHTSITGRSSIHALPGGLGVRGVRMNWSGHSVYSHYHYLKYHLYGTKVPDRALHRVFVCDVDGNELIRDFDFGDRPASQERIWGLDDFYNQPSALYLKNGSPEKIARDIKIEFGGTTSTNLSDDLTLSTNNNDYSNSITIPEIERAVVYGPIWIKRRAVPGEAVGLKQATISINVQKWADPQIGDTYNYRLGYIVS